MKALPQLPPIETSDVRPRRLLLGAGLLMAVMIVCVALAVATVSFDVPDAGKPPTTVERQALRQGVRLETDPRAAGQRLEAAARMRLQTLGWSDRRHNLAHVPIEKAMDMLAAHGWPDEEDR